MTQEPPLGDPASGARSGRGPQGARALSRQPLDAGLLVDGWTCWLSRAFLVRTRGPGGVPWLWRGLVVVGVHQVRSGPELLPTRASEGRWGCGAPSEGAAMPKGRGAGEVAESQRWARSEGGGRPGAGGAAGADGRGPVGSGAALAALEGALGPLPDHVSVVGDNGPLQLHHRREDPLHLQGARGEGGPGRTWTAPQGPPASPAVPDSHRVPERTRGQGGYREGPSQ